MRGRGRLYLLCFGDEGRDPGPHPIGRDDLRAAFDSSRGWCIDSIEPERIETRFHEHGTPAWLAKITRV